MKTTDHIAPPVSGLWNATRIGLAASLMCIPTSYGATVFSNFGSGLGYFYDVGTAVGGPDSQFGEVDKGVPFSVSGSSFHLTELVLPVRKSNASQSAGAAICADAAGVPGAVLEYVEFTPPDTLGTTITISLSGTTTVLSETIYWLVLSTPADGECAWYTTDPPVAGPVARSVDSGATWQIEMLSQPVLKVNGIAVPEVTTSAVCAAGLLCLMLVRRRLR